MAKGAFPLCSYPYAEKSLCGNNEGCTFAGASLSKRRTFYLSEERDNEGFRSKRRGSWLCFCDSDCFDFLATLPRNLELEKDMEMRHVLLQVSFLGLLD